MASGQDGAISWQQLLDCGLSERTVTRWLTKGHLHLHPLGLRGVYLLGHAHATPFSNLAAGLLHAGPGAALSDETALWCYELLGREPHRIHVCTAHHARSHGRVIVHRPRGFAVVSHRRLPLVPLAQALREFATHATDNQVRMALAEADYRGRLDLEAIHAELGRGRPGSARLRRQLARHEPRLARTKSELERLFIAVCERHAVPLPEVNFPIGRMTVDAVWPAQRLAVELDGRQGHRSRAQLTRDHRRAAVCRAHGFAHARYSEDQLIEEPELVAADLATFLDPLSAV